MARKFLYRGMETEQLKQLSWEDFLKILPSTSRRSLKRMGFQIKLFLEKFRKHKLTNSGKAYKTHTREMVIVPEMLGEKLSVYNGKTWSEFLVGPEMLGHRLGEYSVTIKQVHHSGPGVGATRGSKAVELK